MNAIKTTILDGVEEVDRSEFQALCKAAGKTIMWGLLHVPTRFVGNDWPDYSKEAAVSVGAILPE